MSATARLWNYRRALPLAAPRIPTLASVGPRELLSPQRKCPSKQLHDRNRSLQRDQVFNQRRQERLRLWGYVELKNGDVLSLDDALRKLRDGLSRNPNRQVAGISKDRLLRGHKTLGSKKWGFSSCGPILTTNIVVAESME